MDVRVSIRIDNKRVFRGLDALGVARELGIEGEFVRSGDSVLEFLEQEFQFPPAIFEQMGFGDHGDGWPGYGTAKSDAMIYIPISLLKDRLVRSSSGDGCYIIISKSGNYFRWEVRPDENFWAEAKAASKTALAEIRVSLLEDRLNEAKKKYEEAQEYVKRTLEGLEREKTFGQALAQKERAYKHLLGVVDSINNSAGPGSRRRVREIIEQRHCEAARCSLCEHLAY